MNKENSTGLRPVMWVHGSVFHLDDCLCAAMGRIMGYEVKRTLDKDIASNAGPSDLICDVGRVYDGIRNFDHHQPDAPYAQAAGIETRFPFSKPASAGYLWNKMHKTIIECIDRNVPKEIIPEIRDTIDYQIIAPSDRIDVGEAELPPDITTLSAAIGYLNPTSNVTEDFDVAFEFAVDMVERVFVGAIKKCLHKIYSRETVTSSPIVNGNILVLDSFVPWTGTVINDPKFNNVLYVVYPSMRGGWNGQVVPISGTERAARKDFPIEWAGLTGKSLAACANLPEAEGYFCHVARFLIAAPTKELAIKMCQIAAEA